MCPVFSPPSPWILVAPYNPDKLFPTMTSEIKKYAMTSPNYTTSKVIQTHNSLDPQTRKIMTNKELMLRVWWYLITATKTMEVSRNHNSLRLSVYLPTKVTSPNLWPNYSGLYHNRPMRQCQKQMRRMVTITMHKLSWQASIMDKIVHMLSTL